MMCIILTLNIRPQFLQNDTPAKMMILGTSGSAISTIDRGVWQQAPRPAESSEISCRPRQLKAGPGDWTVRQARGYATEQTQPCAPTAAQKLALRITMNAKYGLDCPRACSAWICAFMIRACVAACLCQTPGVVLCAASTARNALVLSFVVPQAVHITHSLGGSVSMHGLMMQQQLHGSCNPRWPQ